MSWHAVTTLSFDQLSMQAFQQRNAVDGGATPIQTFKGKAMDGIPTASAKIMMNLWVFAQPNPFGDGKTNAYPIKSEYEYFHFYKWDQDTVYPCSPAPACLPAADKANSQNNPSEQHYGT